MCVCVRVCVCVRACVCVCVCVCNNLCMSPLSGVAVVLCPGQGPQQHGAPVRFYNRQKAHIKQAPSAIAITY